jgi:hypothetical protein
MSTWPIIKAAWSRLKAAYRAWRNEDDFTHWKEVCYAHEAELQWLRADVKRMREALTWYAQDYDYKTPSIIWDGGAIARAALDPDGQKERRAKALSDLAEMDADLLDIDPEVKP